MDPLTPPWPPGVVGTQDNNCKMAEIDADTSARGGEIWFTFECTIECPSEDVRTRTHETPRHVAAARLCISSAE